MRVRRKKVYSSTNRFKCERDWLGRILRVVVAPTHEERGRLRVRVRVKKRERERERRSLAGVLLERRPSSGVWRVWRANGRRDNAGTEGEGRGQQRSKQANSKLDR